MPQPTAAINEPPEELARLREDLVAFYRPANSQERVAVERVALAQQSILRAARLESSLFANPPGKQLHSVLEAEGFKLLLRYQAQAERTYRRALDELLFLQSQRRLMPAPPKPADPAPKPQLIKPQSSAGPFSPPHTPAPAQAPPKTPAVAAAANLALRL
jgi:hypothetical protein